MHRSYQQFCPIACGLDLIGDRWTLLMLRELAKGPRRFVDLERALSGIGPNLLSARLDDLIAAGLIEPHSEQGATRRGYVRTELGAAADEFLLPLARWGMPLLAKADVSGADVGLVPLAIRSLVRWEELDSARLTARLVLDIGEFDLVVSPAGPPGNRYPFSERISVTFADGEPPGHVVMTGSFMSLIGGAAAEAFTFAGADRHVVRLWRAFGLAAKDGAAGAV